jgi:hypothetical protein
MDRISFRKRYLLQPGISEMPDEVWYMYINGVRNADYFIRKTFDSDGSASACYAALDKTNLKKGRSRIDMAFYSELYAAKRALIEWYYEDNNGPH